MCLVVCAPTGPPLPGPMSRRLQVCCSDLPLLLRLADSAFVHCSCQLYYTFSSAWGCGRCSGHSLMWLGLAQAGQRMHTFPRPVFTALSWTESVSSCLPERLPHRDLSFSTVANLYTDAEQVSRSMPPPLPSLLSLHHRAPPLSLSLSLSLCLSPLLPHSFPPCMCACVCVRVCMNM